MCALWGIGMEFGEEVDRDFVQCRGRCQCREVFVCCVMELGCRAKEILNRTVRGFRVCFNSMRDVVGRRRDGRHGCSYTEESSLSDFM